MRQRRTVLTPEQEVGARELVTLTGALTFGDALRAFLLAIQQPGTLREAVTGLGGVSVPARAIGGPPPYLDVTDPEVRAVLEDPTLSRTACARQLNCSKAVVTSAKRRLGLPTRCLFRAGDRLLPMRLEEDAELREALADRTVSAREVAARYGLRHERVNRTRRRLGINNRAKKIDWSGARLDLLRSGKSGQEIAHTLGIALRTVTQARQKIFGPFNKAALIRVLRELGDVPITAELLAYHLGRSTTAVRQLVKKVTGEELP